MAAGPRQDAAVTRYRQYCPVARAAEILAERWTPLVIRNLLFGATTFSAIAAGVPAMSRSMLTRRLRELEVAGVLRAMPKPNGQGHTYALTEAGADLVGVIDAMGHWAERWVEVLPEHADVGFALWAWCRVQLNHATLPRHRVLVAFEFPDERPGDRRYWLIVDPAGAEVCLADPGGEPDLHVVAASRAFVDWHRGVLTWSAAQRQGSISVTGERRLVRAFPTWNTRAPRLAV
jgi:DNA-binding HxlR family transcriptional regulator